jgi:hypothetical protein
MLPWKPVVSVRRNEEQGSKISLPKARKGGGNDKHISIQINVNDTTICVKRFLQFFLKVGLFCFKHILLE